jgi:hypothetical protein
VEDLRDIGGRLVRLFVSLIAGVTTVFSIATGIDWLTRHDGRGFRGIELPVLVAGVAACTFGCYVVLQAFAHRRRPSQLPPARVVSTR